MNIQHLTERQRLACADLQKQGFTIDNHERSVICMRRGNDFRVVQLDGAQKRGVGAKR